MKSRPIGGAMIVIGVTSYFVSNVPALDRSWIKYSLTGGSVVLIALGLYVLSKQRKAVG